MKNLYPLVLIILMSTTAYAKSLNPNLNASLYDHLVEVNKEWLKITDDNFLCEPASFKNDTERIKMHLKLVERYLRENQPAGLNAAQLENRSSVLNILNNYWKAGKFPQNTFHKKRQPYFVDSYGTACAVGYLALETGASELVDRIAEEKNYAYIAELKNHYPELLDWAKTFGFTVEELAWIQPAYSPLPQTWNTVGNGGGCDGKINVMKAKDDEMLYLAGEFSEVDGVPANSIIAWDGESWHSLGEGVNGIVHDIEIDHLGTVYIGGDFYVNGQPELINLAYFKDEAWHGFETSNMTGVVYTIHKPSGRLYVGGDFEMEDLDENVIRNLAFIEHGETILQNENGAFSVNGPVYDFDNNDNHLLVAGDFTQTATYSSDPEINQLETDYLAYWKHYLTYNWVAGFDHDCEALGSVKIIDSKIYVGSKWSGPTGAGYFDAGIWKYINSFAKLDEGQPELMHGILSHNDMIIYYGNIYFIPVIGTWSRGIYVQNGSPGLSSEGADFDAQVTAAESFQDQIYFVGDFTSVQGQEFPGLVSSPFDGISSVGHLEDKNRIEVYHSGNQLYIKSEPFQEDLTLNIYSLNGQLLHSEKLQPGSGEKTISTHNWAAGMYIYNLSGNGASHSGKLAVF